MKRSTLALVLALATMPAHAQLVEIQWNADGQFAHKAEVRGGSILELCGKLPAGLAIDWSFNSTVPLESNVHFHEGTQVTYPAKHPPATSLTDRLNVKIEQDYCWMWSNLIGRPFQVEVQLVKVK